MDHVIQHANGAHIKSIAVPPTPSPTRPTPLTPNWAGIHPELVALKQWVLWRYKLTMCREGHKWTKVPYQPNGKAASSVDVNTWSSFDTCKSAYEHQTEQHQFDGIGFVTSKEDPYVLLDLDHILHPSSAVDDWVKEIILTAKDEGGYIEQSVGGDGIHIIGIGPQGFKGRKSNAAEAYCHSRFFTVSGQSIDLPSQIGTVSQTLDLILARIGCGLEGLLGNAVTAESSIGNQVPQAVLARVGSLAPVDDATILTMARSAKNADKFTRLFDDGDTSEYENDDSSADLALTSLISFWTGPDVPRIESLMRSSALSRAKWDQHKTYLSITINKALSGKNANDFYDWSRQGAVGTLTNPAIQPVLSKMKCIGGGITGQFPIQPIAFLTTSKGEIVPNVNNVILLLENDLDIQGVVRYNEFAECLEIFQPIPNKTGAPDTRKYPRKWEDVDSVALQAYIQRLSIHRVARDTVTDALQHYAQDCRYHPVREYFNSLKWDGSPRIKTWLINYCNADPAVPVAYLEEVGSKFLISAVARVMRPGCKADHSLVLEGPQGVGKSTALSTLAGDDWFTDALPSDLNSKDAAIHLRGRLIIEMSELSQFSRTEIETIKAYLTRKTDKYRPPFGRNELEIPRQCVFAGSTNSDGYLIDSTGNRRFWPVKVGAIKTSLLLQDRDQLWAEAYVRYLGGEAWHMTDQRIIAMQREQAADRVVSDPWRVDVMKILNDHGQNDITAGEVLSKMLDLRPTDRHKGNAARVSGIMRELGWSKGKRHCIRGQVYHPPATEGQMDLFDSR